MKSRKRLAPTIFVLLLSVLLLTGCTTKEDKSKVEFNDAKSIYVYESEVKPEYAQIKEGYLYLTLDWSFGKDEDSMKKKNFLNSEISTIASQGGEILVWDPEKSISTGDDIYEKSHGNVTLAFKLLNEQDPVDFNFYWSGLKPKKEDTDLTVDIKNLEPSK